MTNKKTQEPLNQIEYDTYMEKGPVKIGPWTSWMWRDDPKHLSFMLARYKFCSKLLDGKERVLEIGCGDAFGVSIILQVVKEVHCVDIDPLVIEESRKVLDKELLERIKFSIMDFTKQKIEENVEAVYSLDCFEHIPKERESYFFNNICNILPNNGVCIIGVPNKDAEKFANEMNIQGHINLKTAKELKELMLKHFENVFIFSMNDEVVHTGFYGMAHYLFALGVGKKSDKY